MLDRRLNESSSVEMNWEISSESKKMKDLINKLPAKDFLALLECLK